MLFTIMLDEKAPGGAYQRGGVPSLDSAYGKPNQEAGIDGKFDVSPIA